MLVFSTHPDFSPPVNGVLPFTSSQTFLLQKVWYANAVIVAVVAFLAVAASLAAVQAVIAAGRILAWVVGIGAADYLPDRYRALVAVVADIPVDRIGTLVAVAA